jgi:hypothetical protein
MKVILTLLACLFQVALPAAGAERPNLIRIMADDLGRGPYKEN